MNHHINIIDPYDKLVEVSKKLGPRPPDPNFGLISNLIITNPELRDRTRDEGFDARLEGLSIDANPNIQDGTYEWWRQGWLAADDNLRGEP